MSTTTITPEALRHEFEQHVKLFWWIASQRLKDLGMRYDDELIQEAVCHAWVAYGKCRQRLQKPERVEKELARHLLREQQYAKRLAKWMRLSHRRKLEKPAPRKPEFSLVAGAIRLAAKTGISRALRRSRFVPSDTPRYLDAMDVRGRGACERLDAAGETLRNVVDRGHPDAEFDPMSRDSAEALIDVLPEGLRPVARLLSYGMTRQLVAERRGVSSSTLHRQIELIQLFVRAALRERKQQQV